ncbi:hypothetical protein [Acrocarpospora catenulata]|uniref:hypothetical protein n=1 Tax=Acrocarpospora catenulata TaxID=2836182 RepID=UPI001BDABE77|nr:hypothetical protein [Acrocarpospora catenulata]
MVDGVTDVVDGVTGNALAPVTDGVDKTVSGVAGVAGNLGASTGTGGSPTAQPSPSPTQGQSDKGVGGVTGALTKTVTKTVQDTCLPLLAAPDCGQGKTPKGDEPSKTRPSEAADGDGTLPPEPERPVRQRPEFVDSDEQGTDPAPGNGDGNGGDEGGPIDLDRAGMSLLWPGQFVPGLSGHSPAVRGRPHQTYDPVGTALTAVLLLSAVLATRVVAARRAREEREAEEALPLSGLPLPASSRHRLA